MLSGWFSLFIILWVLFLILMLSIGGFFMFRKFLKRLPKEDGMSSLDWEDYYIQHSLHLWSKEQKILLEKLILPVPALFKDIARNKIVGTIGRLAIQNKSNSITNDLLIKGYILATPKRDHKFLIKTLEKEQINISQYHNLFD